MKLFYTDPIAAAWMEKYFNIRFQILIDYGGGNERLGEKSPFYWSDEVHHYGDNSQKYYIHPDSLHLLEPREEDILNNSLGHPTLIRTGAVYCIDLNEVHQIFDPKDLKIIQRNGIAFIWPECEE